MKRIIGISSLILVLVLISTFLYKSGKGHEINMINPSINNVTPIKEMSIKLDGNEKIYKVKNKKKMVAMVKGSSHDFILNFQVDGKPVELKGKFETKIGQETTIDLAMFASSMDNWVIYKEKIKED